MKVEIFSTDVHNRAHPAHNPSKCSPPPQCRNVVVKSAQMRHQAKTGGKDLAYECICSELSICWL